MPIIRSSTFKYYVLLASSIVLDREIISPYSYYVKKGLVYVVIAEPSSHQLFSYSKCTKLNTYILYNVRLVPFNKCIFFTCFNSL